MTDRDPLLALREQLAPIDLSPARADQIARLARQSVGRRRSPRLLLEPAAATLFSTSFFAWMVLKLVEVFS
jgi:hypothetical protein